MAWHRHTSLNCVCWLPTSGPAVGSVLRAGVNTSNYGRRAFSFAGPRAWNSLPEYLRQASSFSVFKRCLKTYLFKSQNASSALETICNCIMGYISVLFTHLLTLLMVRDGQGKSIRHAQYPVTVIPQVLPERIGQLSE